MFRFGRKLLSLSSNVYVRFGRAFDPFGCPVDDDGNSYDPCGRLIDTAGFVSSSEGEPIVLPSRDREYTRELSEQIAAAFLDNNIIQSTHLASMAYFNLLRLSNPETSLMRLVRVGGTSDAFPLHAFYAEMDRLLAALRSLARKGRVVLAPELRRGDVVAMAADAFLHFDTFHSRPALKRVGDRVRGVHRSLVFYYQNRLEGYGLAQDLGLAGALDLSPQVSQRYELGKSVEALGIQTGGVA